MKSTLSFLFSLHKFGMKFGLRNIKSLLHYLNDPQNQFPSIHIAGTNGKGSTSAMIAAMLTASGYKVGLYTSPHLVRFNERIRINGKMIPDKSIVYYTKKLHPEIMRRKATFFEATTAIAMRYFADQKIDIAVIETGLGGRLDSTNVITPLVSVITTIGIDHTEQLGNTIKKIAAEKAGIIKKNIPVVVGNLRPVALSVIRSTARKNKSEFVDSKKIVLPSQITLDLKSSFQIDNAKSALAAVQTIAPLFKITTKAVRVGLEQTRKMTGIQGRFEVIPGRPRILIDVGHNSDAVRSLVRALLLLHEPKMIVIFGIMKDKDYVQALVELKKLRSLLIITQSTVERALPAEILFAAAKKLNIQCILEPNLIRAIRKSSTLIHPTGLRVLCGSHYLVGEALPYLKRR